MEKTAGIENREQFALWLDNNRPSKEICIALAARAALRALPLAAAEAPLASDSDDERRFAQLIAALFRATALTRVAAKYPSLAENFYADAETARAAVVTADKALTSGAHYAATAAEAAAASALEDIVAARAAVASVASAARAIRRASTRARAVGTAAWEALSADVSHVEAGANSRGLADAPLWPEGAPIFTQNYWRKLVAALPKTEGWRVWVQWYEARLKGDPWSEEREFVYVTVPVEVWTEGPAAANASIAERLEELDSKGSDQADPPSSAVAVPASKPATVEPVIRDGKIILPADAAQPELDARAFEEALKALRSLIADLADDLDGEANIDKRAIALLRRIAERIPDSAPSQAQLFGLAHQQETLEDYGRKVIAEWPDLLASRYLGVVRAFDGTIRQFGNWRAFKQNALKDRLTEEQRAKAPALGKRFAEALRDAANAKHVDPAIAAVIEAIAEDLKRATDDSLPRERTAHGADTRPEDLVTSVENTIKRIGDAAVQADVEKKAEATYGAKVLRGAASQIFQGEKLGENIGKWATNIFLAAGAGYAGTHTAELSAVITDLMQQFPNYTHWLQPLIDHLKR